jgi:electron transport complex protein RnfB
MDFSLVLPAIGALSLIGLLSALMLATAAQKFHVDVDPRVQAILDVLPGANCGACGQPGCFSAAEAMAEERAPVTLCVAGGQSVANHVAQVMGKDSCEVASVISCRRCGGGTAAVHSFTYAGTESCNAASRLAGGELACPYGCFGHGDCVVACPFDAMSLDERRLPVIDLQKCTGCGVCVAECPRGSSGLLELIPDTVAVAVRCASHDRIKERRIACPNSCIACKKCERACPSDAIHVIDMLAVVDPEKCTGCYSCVEVCPQDCIDVTGIHAPAVATSLDGKASGFDGFASTAPRAEPVGVTEAGDTE